MLKIERGPWSGVGDWVRGGFPGRKAVSHILKGRKAMRRVGV